MKIYLAGPMRSIKYFNFPAFHAAAAQLRALGHEVFSPAERDIAIHGEAFSKASVDGDNAVAERDHGFSLREALADDLAWICRHAEAVVLLPGWMDSKGAIAERAAALAIGLPAFELADFLAGTFGVAFDPSVNLVRVEFGSPVAWLAMSPELAIEFAKTLLKHAGAKKVEVSL